MKIKAIIITEYYITYIVKFKSRKYILKDKRIEIYPNVFYNIIYKMITFTDKTKKLKKYIMKQHKYNF